ncbi:MAG: DUF559 domain-containing protein [Myxococcales bacterium]|nr:DUF559 domain-containing protein [Myxococcales bacterium]
MRFLFPSFRHERTFLAPAPSTPGATPRRRSASSGEALRGRRLGVKFRRQVVLGTVIVDFFAPEPRLAVEVDGASTSAASGATASGMGTSRATACASFA